jgi:AcrR family transcriptional regulator
VVTVALSLLEREGVSGFTTRTLAREATTSTPAVYELFGDKTGVVRELFFEGFGLLRGCLDNLIDSDDPRADLVRLMEIYRSFIKGNPVLAQVMFSRPFSDFEPSESEVQAGSSVRVFIVERVRRCTETGALRGDATDIAHVLVALVLGLVAAENAKRLGTTQSSVDRRWSLALDAVLDGFAT